MSITKLLPDGFDDALFAVWIGLFAIDIRHRGAALYPRTTICFQSKK
jgi:hypothetical protein